MVLPGNERVKAVERMKRRVEEIKANRTPPINPPEIEPEEGEESVVG